MVTLIKALYVVAAVMLAIYGLQAVILSILAVWHRRYVVAQPAIEQWPSVTIQLPIYNELYVAERLLQAVARIRYPRERLEIQVLDDSTDETSDLIAREVERLRLAGFNIALVHRVDRTGYKAGAMKEGLQTASGELVAIFDADFLPTADFLERTVPHLAADERLAFVQTRWGHVNAGCSSLTGAQSLALDGHFMVEQCGRQRSGLFMPFNGTAGIWRRAAIEAAGGWSADTLCEDLDLSYRAQIAGWRVMYLPEVETPAELPPQMAALKRQQARWAQGSIQCLLKLAGPILTSKAALPARLMATAHLTAYGSHPFALLLFLCTLPLLWLDGGIRIPALSYLGLAGLGPIVLQLLGQRALYGKDWPRRLTHLPFLLLLGTGLSWQNSLAVGKAILRRPATFLRTPKFKILDDSAGWEVNRYALGLDATNICELLLMAYAGVTILVAIYQRNYVMAPLMFSYLFGFGYVALFDVGQRWRLTRQRSRASRLAPLASK